MISSKLNLGIIGFGKFAQGKLLPAIQLSENVDLIAIQKRDLHMAKKLAEEFHIAQVFSNEERLLQNPNVDAVIVTSPPGLHKAHALLAANAGKHILITKPIAANQQECREIIVACMDNNVKLMSGFVMRYCESVCRVKEIIHSGRLGQIQYADAAFTIDAVISNRDWLEDPLMSAGGCMADLGIHLIDLLQFILGDEIISLKATLAPPYTRQSIEWNGIAMLNFRKGTLGTIFTSFKLPNKKFISFYGDKGTLSFTNFSAVDAEVSIKIRDESGLEEILILNADPYLHLITSFAYSVLNNKPVEISGEVGWKNQTILDSIYRNALIN